MKQKAKILLTLASGVATIAPFLITMSNSASRSAGIQYFGNDSTEFSGKYVENSYIDFTKSGPQNNTDIFLNFSNRLNDNTSFEWTNYTGSWGLYSYAGLSGGSSFKSTSIIPNDEGSLKSVGIQNVVNIEEITPGTMRDSYPLSNMFYNMSVPKKRRWRATFNNWYVPNNPGWGGAPANASQGLKLNTYGNIRFGVALTKDIQLVDNSVRIAMFFQDQKYQLQPESDGVVGKVWELVNNDMSIFNYNTPVYLRPRPTRTANNEFNLDKFNVNQIVIGNTGFNQKFNWQPANDPGWTNDYNTPYILHNLAYETVDNNSSTQNDVYWLQQAGREKDGPPDNKWSNFLMGDLLPFNDKEPRDQSAYAKNLRNIGSVLYGRISNGNYWYANSKYNPTVVMEFETVDNMDEIGNQWPFAETTPSGITATVAWYRGYNGLGDKNNTVASNSVSFDRSNYRTIKVQIQEQAVGNEKISEANLNNVFLPDSYGYELWWKNTKIAEFPETIVEMGKGDTYQTAIKGNNVYNINLTFRTDVSKWPADMKSEANFLNSDNLVLKRYFKDPKIGGFFYNYGNTGNDESSHHSVSWREKYKATDGNLGGTFFDTNSWERDGSLLFYSDVQWNNTNGFNKLYALNGSETAQSVNHAYFGPANLKIYDKWDFNNQKLLKDQSTQFVNAIFSDWDSTHFGDNNIWLTNLYNLLQADYEAPRVLNEVNNWYQPVMNYLADPNSNSSQEFQKNNLWLNVYQQSESTEAKQKNTRYIQYIFNSPELQKQLKDGINNLANWESVSTPKFEGTTDTNESAKKINDLIQAVFKTIENLVTAKSLGFDNKQQTATELIATALSKIDTLSTQYFALRTIALFKNAVLSLTNREDVIKYVNALLELQTKLQNAQSIYNKYSVVPTDKYAKLHSNVVTSTYQAFLTNLNQTKTLLKTISDTYKPIKGLTQQADTTLEKVLNFNKQFNPESIETSYQAINVDILNAKAQVNAFSGLTAEQKTNLNNKLDGILTSENPNYKLLENYPDRELKIAAILIYAKFINLINSQQNNIWTQNSYPITTASYTNTINLQGFTNKQVDGVELQLGTESHPELPNYDANGYKAWIIPNTTVDSASVNYWWQPSAKELSSGNTNYPKVQQEWNVVDLKNPYTLGNKILTAFETDIDTTHFTSEQQLNTFYNDWVAKFNLINELDNQYLTAKGNNWNNEAIYQNLHQSYVDDVINSKVDNSAKIKQLITNLATQFTELNNLFNQYLVMPQGKSQVELTNSDYIFGNGQFYGSQNKDHAQEWVVNGEIQLPLNSQNVLPLIATLYQVLGKDAQGTFNGFNGTTTTANLPAALSVVLASKYNINENNYWVYESDKLELLINALKETFNSLLNGRYVAAKEFPNTFSNYFAMDKKGTPLYTQDDVSQFIQEHQTEFNAQTFEWKNNADAPVYKLWTHEFIKNKLIEWFNEPAQKQWFGKYEASNALQALEDIPNTTFADTLENQHHSALSYLQAWQYEVQQIIAQKEAAYDLVKNYPNLTTAQKEALKVDVSNWSMFDGNSIHIYSNMDKYFDNVSNVNEKLYIEPLKMKNFATFLSELNTITGKLNNLVDTINSELHPNQTNEDPLLKLASNRASFITAYNLVSPTDFSKFANIIPSATNQGTPSVTQLYDNLKAEYDKLNGYYNQLVSEISEIDPKIKAYITEPKFNTATDISTVSQQINKAQKDAAYKSVLEKLATAVANQINTESNLNPAQKADYAAQTKAATITKFNDLVPIIENAQAKNTAMGLLQDQINIANTTKTSKAELIKQLAAINSPELAAFNNAYQAAITIKPQDSANGEVSTVEAINTATENLKKALNDLDNAFVKQEIRNELSKIDNNSSKALQDYKNTVNDYLNQPHTTAELQNKLAEVKDKILKDPLQKAIENAESQSPISPELQTAINTAKGEMDTVSNATEVQTAVNKLNDAIKRNELKTELDKAKAISNPSTKLQNVIKDAENTWTNSNVNDYQNQIDKLKDAVRKEALDKSIDTANNLPAASKQNNELQEALNNANSISNNPNATDEQIADAKDKLDKAIANANKVATLKEELQKLIDQAKQTPNNAWMNDYIQTAQGVHDNVNATENDVNAQISKLKEAIATAEFANKVADIQTKNPNPSNKLTSELETANNLITKAKNELANNQATNSTVSNATISELTNEATKLENTVTKEPLAKAIANASAVTEPTNKDDKDAYSKLQTAIETANKEYNVETPVANTINDQAAKLNTALDIYHLAQTVNQATPVENKTTGYQQIFDDASKILNAVANYNDLTNEQIAEKVKEALNAVQTPALKETNLTPQEVINLATKLLNEATLKEPLEKKVVEANKVLERLNNKANENPAGLETEIANIKKQYDALNTAITDANNKLAITPVEAAQSYIDQANSLNTAINTANSFINQELAKLQDAITKANAVEPKSLDLTVAISSAEGLLKLPNSNMVDVEKEIAALNKEVAKNKLSNAIDLTPSDLKKNETFKQDILDPATKVLNDASSTTSDYNEQVAKIETAIKKQPLYEAYNNALSQNPKRPELQEALKNAKAILDDPNNQYKDQNEDFFNDEAAKLNKEVALNELNNALTNAKNVPTNEQSDELKAAITNAENTLSNPTNSTTEQIQAQTKDLQNVVDRNNLVNALKEANDLLPTFGDPNDPNHKQAKELKDAIDAATKVNANKTLTKAKYDEAANTLKAVVEKLQQALNNQKDRLKELIKQDEELNADWLNPIIKHAKAVDSNNAATLDQINEQIAKLETSIDLNALKELIKKVAKENAPVSNELSQILADGTQFVTQAESTLDTKPFTTTLQNEITTGITNQTGWIYQGSHIEPGFKAYDKLTSLPTTQPESLQNDYQTAMNNAQSILDNIVNNLAPTTPTIEPNVQTQINNQANNIKLVGDIFDLQTAVANANKISNQSQDLQNAIKDANTILNGLQNQNLNDWQANNQTANTIKEGDLTNPKLKAADITTANELVNKAAELLNNAILKNNLSLDLEYAKKVQTALANATTTGLKNNSSITNATNTKTAYETLSNKITAAENLFNQEPVATNEEYNNTAKQLLADTNQAKTQYTNAISELSTQLGLAEDANPKSSELTNAITEAQTLLDNAKAAENTMDSLQGATAIKLIDAADKLMNEIAKNNLANVMNSVPKELKDNATFNTNAWTPANTVLNDANSNAEAYDKAAKALEYELTKQKLYEAYKDALAQNPINAALQTLMDEAKTMLDDKTNNPAKTEADFNNEADKLLKAIELNKLDNTKQSADQITPKSQELQDAITKANETLANPNNKTTAEITAQTKDLQNVADRNKLINALTDANNLLPKLNGADAKTLRDAITEATTVNNNKGLTKAEYDAAADKLNAVVKEFADKLAHKKEALEELIKQAKDTNHPWMNDLIKDAENVANNPVATDPAIDNQINKLTVALELDKLKTRTEAVSTSNPTPSHELKGVLDNSNNLINQIETAIKQDVSNDQVTEFNDKIAAQIKALNKANNLEPVYLANDKVNAISSTQPADLQDSYNQMKELASTVLNDIAATTPDTENLEAAESTAVTEAASNIDLAREIFELKQAEVVASPIQNKTTDFAKIFADAQTLLSAIKDVNLQTAQAIRDKIKELQPQLQTEALKDNNLTNANQIITKATELLQAATVKEPLAKKIAEANKVLELLNNGTITVPENLKDQEMTIEKRKETLQNAVDLANEQINAVPVKTATEYENEADSLDEQIQIAEKLISQIKDALKEEIAKAQTITPAQDYLTNEIATANALLSNPNAKAIELVKEISKLKDLEAKNNLENAINNVPDSLKTNPTFKQQVLDPVTETLNSPNSYRPDYVAAQEKLEQALKKEKLYDAYEKALKQDPKRPELQQALDQAQDMLEDPKGTYKNEPQSVFDTKADELTKQIALNELNNAKVAAESETPKSKELTDKIAASQNTLNNPNNVSTEQINTQTADLKNTADRNNLMNQIATANNLLPTFGDPKDPNNKEAKALADAIKEASAVNDNHTLTREQYDEAANKLQALIKQLQDELKGKKDKLDQLIKEAQKENADWMNDNIAEASNVAKEENPTNASLNEQISKLTTAIDLNHLKELVEQIKKHNPEPSHNLTTTLNNAQSFINKTEAALKEPFTAEQEAKIKVEITNQTNLLNKANNLEPVYKAYDAINNVAKPTDPSLENAHQNMLDAANKLVNAIAATTPDTATLTPEQQTAITNAVNNLELDKNIFDLQSAVAKASGIENKTPELDKIFKDAQNITNAIGNQAEKDFETVKKDITNLQPSFETTALKDAALDTANKIVTKATELLNEATLKEPLAKAIAKANEVNKLLEGVTNTEPANIKDNANKVLEANNNLSTAITTANNELNATPIKDANTYQNDANKLLDEVAKANKVIQNLKDELQNVINEAKNINPAKDYLTNEINTATNQVANSQEPAINVVKEIQKLKDLIAKNKLENVIATIPEIMQQNNKFVNDILKPAEQTLNNADSDNQDFDAGREKIEEALKKEKLYEAYENALKQDPKRPELENAINNAKNILEDPNNDFGTKDQNFFNNEADKLNKEIALNELNNVKDNANKVAKPSKDLTDAINAANESLNNPNAKTEAEIEQQTKNLQNIIDRNNLINALKEANDLAPTFGDPNDPKNTLAKELADAINKANEVNNNHNLTAKEYDQAASDLQDVINKLKDELNKQKQALEDVINNSKAVDPKSNALDNAIKEAEALGENPSYNDIVEHINDLNHNVKTNDLNKAIEEAPTLKEPVPGFTPEIDNSKAIANNPEASQEQIDNQTAKQLLDNAKIDALNQINDLKNINNAQKEALQKQVIAAKTIDELAPIVAQGKELDNAMADAKKYVDNLPESYLTNPISNINYVYATPEEQTAFKDKLDTLNNLLNKETGSVYKDNLGSQIKDLINELNTAKDNLTGDAKYQKIIQNGENELANGKDFTQSNNFFNTTKALQDAYKDVLNQVEKQLEVVKNQTTTPNTAETDKLQDLINQLHNLADEIKKFSDQEYTDNGKKVPQIDHILDNLPNVSDSYKDKIKQDWNNAKTKVEADKILQDALDKIKTNDQKLDDLNKEIEKVIDTNPKDWQPNVVNDLQDKLDKLVNQGVKQDSLQDFQNIVNELDKLKVANTALEEFLNSNAKDETTYNQAKNNLEKAINNLKPLTATNSVNQALIDKFNNQVNNYKTNGQEFIKAIDSLLNNNEAEFNKAIQNLVNQPKIYQDFENVLTDNKYFENQATSADDYSWQDVKDIQKIVNSPEFKEIDNVFKTALTTDRLPKDRLPWYWWLALGILGTSAFATIYGLVKNNKKK
ncbi:hypothetical protein [Mycoplasma hafezii]|uniref:hypothetical protein n=1 Tax=Mycoplasma hafezii TaxID=525886 RepID=UPI003CF438A4